MTYPQPFEDLWAIYPKRSPNNNKRDAYKQYTARLKQKRSYSDIFEGTMRYAICMEKMGNIGTPYVMCAKTFWGASEHFMEEWTPPKQEVKKDIGSQNGYPPGFDSSRQCSGGESMEQCKLRAWRDHERKEAFSGYMKASQEIQGDEYKKDSFEFLKNATDEELDDFIE